MHPHLYWCYPPQVLMLSPNVLNTLHSTEAIPHCADIILPLYWTTSTVLKVSPQYWSYPPTCTAVIPPTVLKVSLHSTEHPSQYWCYPPTVLMLSPRMYWCYPPTVLNNLHSTEAIPHSTEAIPHCTEQPPQYWSYPPQYWSYPPQYWCYPSHVLNNFQCTEQPPQYWTSLWTGFFWKKREGKEGREEKRGREEKKGRKGKKKASLFLVSSRGPLIRHPTPLNLHRTVWPEISTRVRAFREACSQAILNRRYMGWLLEVLTWNFGAKDRKDATFYYSFYLSFEELISIDQSVQIYFTVFVLSNFNSEHNFSRKIFLEK